MAYDDLRGFFPGATPAVDNGGMGGWMSGIFGNSQPNSLGPMTTTAPGAMSIADLGSTNLRALGGGGGMFGSGGMFGGSGLGMNMGTAQLGLGALGSLAQIYSGMQANSLANKQFGLQKQMAETNLNNTIKSYNTALTDRARSRAKIEGQSPDQERRYVEENRMSR